MPCDLLEPANAEHHVLKRVPRKLLRRNAPLYIFPVTKPIRMVTNQPIALRFGYGTSRLTCLPTREQEEGTWILRYKVNARFHVFNKRFLLTVLESLKVP